MRRICLDTRGRIRFTRPGHCPRTLPQLDHQVRKSQKVSKTQKRSPAAELDLRIGRHHVRPLRKHGADIFIIHTQQQSLPVPVIPLAHARELPSAERVERVRHAHKTRYCGGRACILT